MSISDLATLPFSSAHGWNALAPVPLWLASLALLGPDPALLAGLTPLALMLSCGVVYHGLVGLGRVRESILAAATAQMTQGAGLVPWTLVLAAALA